MVYRFKASSYISGVDAQAAGEQCERLAGENRLTARELVKENRPESAPLHRAFEWRDEVAAENWREHQARHIIGALEVVREEAPPVRAFFNIVKAEPEYRHIDVILRSEEETERLLRTARGEFEAFRRKYGLLKKLAGLFAAYDQLTFDEIGEDT